MHAARPSGNQIGEGGCRLQVESCRLEAHASGTLRLVFGLVLVFLFTGCSYFRTEMGQPLSANSRTFTEGQTRVDAVVRQLGPPNRASRLPEGVGFLYEYSRMTEFQLGLGINLPVIRWFKFLKAWNNIEQQNLLLTFDNQGVLRSAGSGNWKESLGGGTGVQFLFMVMSFSDMSQFLRPADAHGWGEMLLQLPPIALNSAQSLRSGQNGLQQRIAPDYAGQHTLEMTTPKTERQKKKIKKDYQRPPEPW
jgi:hypothetical protein